MTVLLGVVTLIILGITVAAVATAMGKENAETPQSAFEEKPDNRVSFYREKIQTHTNEELEQFDIGGCPPAPLWICPHCGAENDRDAPCQVCGGDRT